MRNAELKDTTSAFYSAFFILTSAFPPMPSWRFLDPELADADGLVGVGGDLRPERLLDAYRRGIFPFFDASSPILWWSPDPRAIIEMDGLHVARRLRRTIGSGRFRVSFNRDFASVIRGCARTSGEGVWITPGMIAAYIRLHQLGHAHSVEVWHGEELAGGLYGVAIGGLFAGESMFTKARDASKVALAHLMEYLRGRGFELFDVQFLNQHTASLGAIEIPRREYLTRLRAALRSPASFAALQ
jgi:leucyl/phenylalanyl-tRNA---protein transferase